MISVRSIFTTTVALLAAPILAQVTAGTIKSDLEVLKTKSQKLQATAQQFNIINAPLLMIGQGPWAQFMTGYQDFVQTTTTYIPKQQGAAQIPAGAGATEVTKAYTEFAKAHTQLLNILIEKARFVTSVPFVGPPVAANLRGGEGAVDAYSNSLVNLLPASADTEILAALKPLAEAFDKAIKAYAGNLGEPSF
ncbi:hypothetical protein QBC35DRAFT_452367 [Podospora australis]|uniref:Uncharacterized protein n=1 Tax=Podospora australis TaxID=1536484 RepID=A0AAN6WU29_9PEZI|nr:hypothetical protein QBC35DRAFT_452367 [Podospora australis]